MPDPAALRARRSRAHKTGDHSLCRPERCPQAPSHRAEGSVGEIEAATASCLGGLNLADDDPRSLIAVMAMRLAAALDRHVTASLARELRACAIELVELEPDDAGRSAAASLLRDLKELAK